MRTLPNGVLALILLAGCVADVPRAPLAPAPPTATGIGDRIGGGAWYRKAAQAGQAVYRIDSSRSLIVVTVRRAGALARLGHDHVVASRSIEGWAAPDSGRADFHFQLDAMSVDEPALRSAAGLEKQISAEAIAGTRNNMLTRVLEAERFPLVLLRAERSGQGPGMLRLSVTLHGVTRTMEVPARIERSAGSLAASGEFTLLQTDFGITPMSVMGGAISVQDRMELRFHIVAAPLR